MLINKLLELIGDERIKLDKNIHVYGGGRFGLANSK